MIQLSRLHEFLECNLPEYERKDALAVCKLYLEIRELKPKKPFVELFRRWNDFKNFIIVDWQGFEEESFTRQKKPSQPSHHAKVAKVAKVEHGLCTCGMPFVVRTNRKNGNEFLGCSGYPNCKETKPL